jgi:hypothetical protein
MGRARFSTARVILGIVLIVSSFILLFQILNTISFNERLTSFLGVFSFGMMIGFGAWLLSQYPLKMYLEPFLVITLWAFLIFLPIWLSPLPKDILVLVLGFSPFLALLLWIGYTKLKGKFTGKCPNSSSLCSPHGHP